jgi:UDP-glucose 4-epimerase
MIPSAPDATSLRILVTGANGFVGRALCRALAADQSVYAVDNLRVGPLRFHPDEMCHLSFHRVDIRDPEQVRAVLEEVRPEAIVHLAAIHFIPDCERDPALAVSTNVTGTVNLLAQCRPGCRFVFASSAAVYRPGPDPLTEDGSPVGSVDVYGLSKAQGEQYLRYLARARGFPAVVVRLFNVVGPGETNPHVVPQILAQIRAGRAEITVGNITPRRDFIHVADAATGFVATTLLGEVAPGDVVTVNLGTGRAHSVSDVIDHLAEISGRTVTVHVDPSRVRAFDTPVLRADVSRIRAAFGWTPRFDLRTALRDTWEEPDLADSLRDRLGA